MIESLAHAARTLPSVPHQIALFEVPHASIAEIIIGARAAPVLAKEIEARAKSLGIPVYQARVSHQVFDLERVAIDGE